MRNKMNGAQLCARFAYKPYHLGRCGSSGKKDILLECIKSNTCKTFRESLNQYKTFYSYLKLISEKHSLGILHPKVVEAYWIGNDLLKAFSRNDFHKWVEIYTELYDIKGSVSHLRNCFSKTSLPFIPHHAFQVFFSWKLTQDEGVDSLERVNNCLIRSGEIIDFSKKKISIKSWRIQQKTNSLSMIPSRETINYQTGFFQNLQRGDNLAFHWKESCLRLSNRQLDQLRYYTKLVCYNL